MDADKKLEILVVDDTESIRELNGAIVKGAGYKVLYAKDGEEGINLAREKNPAVILCDYEMPIKNGIEVYYALKKIKGFEDIDDRMIIISGKQKEDIYEKAQELGIEIGITIVEKPGYVLNLEKMITERVERYNTRHSTP